MPFVHYADQCFYIPAPPAWGEMGWGSKCKFSTARLSFPSVERDRIMDWFVNSAVGEKSRCIFHVEMPSFIRKIMGTRTHGICCVGDFSSPCWSPFFLTILLHFPSILVGSAFFPFYFSPPPFCLSAFPSLSPLITVEHITTEISTDCLMRSQQPFWIV